MPLTATMLLTLYIGNPLRRRAGDGELPYISTLPASALSPHQLQAKQSFAGLPKAVLCSEAASPHATTMLPNYLRSFQLHLHPLLTSMCESGPKDSSSSSLPTTELTASSSTSVKDQSPLTLAGTAPLGTGISPAPGTTQAVVITDV